MNTFSKSFSKFLFALLFVAAISFSISFSSYAQNTTSLGIKGGVNLANFRGEDVEDFDNRTAFNLGLVLNYSVAEKVGLSLEADYSSQGAKLDLAGIESTTKLDYIRTTLLFNYFMGTNEMTIRPKLFVGPYLGFLTSAQGKVGEGNYDDSSDGVYKSMDFGGSFGAGLHLKVGEKIWLTPDVRYNLGFTNIYDAGSDDISGRNGVLSVNLGLTFPLN